MFYKCIIFTITTMSLFISLSSCEYEIQDLGTLHAHSSCAIDLNNQGDVLGKYRTNDDVESQQYFIRYTNGNQLIIPHILGDTSIEWRFLTDRGEVFGTGVFQNNSDNALLFSWNSINGVVKLGELPGRNVVAVNNQGQVLIGHVLETKSPEVWQDGLIKILDDRKLSIPNETEASYGTAINNHSDVVGTSCINVVYGEKEYKSYHSVMWKASGEKKDFHNKFNKTLRSYSKAINDNCDILIVSQDAGSIYCFGRSGKCVQLNTIYQKINNIGYVYKSNEIYDVKNSKMITSSIKLKMMIEKDKNSIWLPSELDIIKVNDRGEIISTAKTFYGEDHGVILKPKRRKN